MCGTEMQFFVQGLTATPARPVNASAEGGPDIPPSEVRINSVQLMSVSI